MRSHPQEFAAPTLIVREKEDTMPAVKLLVLYPRPKDIEAFEKLYQDEHVPMAVEKLGGKTRFVATKVLGSPNACRS